MDAIVKRAVLVGGALSAFVLFFAAFDVAGRAYPAQPLLFAAGAIVLAITFGLLYMLGRPKPVSENVDAKGPAPR
jgi:cytochrome c biogenesis protein CcdA